MNSAITAFVYIWPRTSVQEKEDTEKFLTKVSVPKSVYRVSFITGAQPKAGSGDKMQTISFFQRYIVRGISLAHWGPVSST